MTPSANTCSITFVLITLGAANFIEFLGAYYIIEVISMIFRLYIVPLWKYYQEILEKKAELL